MNESLIEVYRAENAPQAHLIKDQLEALGIPACVEGDYLQGALGGLPLGWAAAPRVLVAESHAPLARQAIEKFAR